MPRVRQFQYALYPNARQERLMHRLLDGECQLYNGALSHRREVYRLARARGVPPPRTGYVEQCRELTGVLRDDPALAAFGVTVSRGTLRRVDRAFGAFFRRVAAGQKPGYPRFRSVRRFDSVSYEDRSGWKLDQGAGRLYLMGVGHLKVRLHRRVLDEARLRSCVVRRQRVVRRRGHPPRARWSVTVAVELPDAVPLAPTGRRCGVDLGVRHLATVVDESGSVAVIANPRPLAAAAARLAAAQQRLARAERGSNRRATAVRDVAAAHAKVANARRWWGHQVSHDLVRHYDLIAIEDLHPSAMSRSAAGTVEAPGTNVAAKRGLNRAILDAGWGQLRRHLSYKAAEAGREVVVVSAHHTSQACSRCGHTHPANRRGAVFRCRSCAHTADADVNAAVNILQRAESARQPPAA
ncbi:MAG TPA: transposase [Acidimicrobiales bacterium]|nr:transposase [Acidimicrobiales bacterium]